jgi:hypothetical protein
MTPYLHKWYNFCRRKLNMRKIHNFNITGVIGDDSKIIQSREMYEKTIVQQMRDKGYVPVLDMAPQFNTSYIEKKNQYGFSLTMFAVYVGRSKSQQYEGFSGQDFIPR